MSPDYDDLDLALYYYPDENLFTDSEGHIIYNIFKYITPGELMLFKREKTYYSCYGKFGITEIFYKEDDNWE